MMDKNKITVKTRWGTVGDRINIEQELLSEVIRYSVETKEKAIRDALISLGWTPPKGTIQQTAAVLPVENPRVWIYDEEDQA